VRPEKLTRLDSAAWQGQNGNVWQDGNMSKTPWHIALFVLAMFLLLPLAATAQVEKSSNKADTDPENAKAVKASRKQSLQSVTLPSTAEAVRKVAEQASAKALAPGAAPKASKQPGTDGATDGAVLEFHPANGPPTAGLESGTFQVKGRKKSVLKNIHGSAYGAAASAAGRASDEGGAVGADSGNGKFNVYVEGEHAHTSTPAPH
jgi:hypothetical protein